MVAQYLKFHKGEKHLFKMDIVQKFKRPMQRQIAEAVNIQCSSDNVIMKSKSELMQPATTRMVANRQVEERKRGRLLGDFSLHL